MGEKEPMLPGPLWPWVKAAEEVASDLGFEVSLVNLAPFSGISSDHASFKFLGAMRVHVGTDGGVGVTNDTIEVANHALGDKMRGLYIGLPGKVVRTPGELRPVLREILARHEPDKAFMQLMHDRVEPIVPIPAPDSDRNVREKLADEIAYRESVEARLEHTLARLERALQRVEQAESDRRFTLALLDAARAEATPRTKPGRRWRAVCKAPRREIRHLLSVGRVASRAGATT